MEIDTSMIINVATCDAHQLQAAGAALVDGRREGAYRRNEATESAGQYPAWFAPDVRATHIDDAAERSRIALGRRYVTALNGAADELEGLRTYVRDLARDSEAVTNAEVLVADLEVHR